MIPECSVVVRETAFEFCFVRISCCDSIVEIETRCRIVTDRGIYVPETRDRLDILWTRLEVCEEDITSITIATELIECKTPEFANLAIIGSLGEDLRCEDLCGYIPLACRTQLLRGNCDTDSQEIFV
jgi:hypothetical protein